MATNIWTLLRKFKNRVKQKESQRKNESTPASVDKKVLDKSEKQTKKNKQKKKNKKQKNKEPKETETK